MRHTFAAIVVLVSLTCVVPASRAQSAGAATESAAIIAIERAAMDRWAKGDPSGFLEIMAPEVTVFDAFADRRLDGRPAVVRHYEQFRGRVSIPRYEFLNPTVQPLGETGAILTYNFIAYGVRDEVLSRWNFTEAYERRDGKWQILHSHASYTRGGPATP